MDILSFILGFKKGIASGGGGGSATVDPVHTVIFMSWDGTEVLYQRSVVDGDDCADVVKRGLLAKPTKESTPQYSYTNSGWSMTSGGAASSSALSAVTEDRTVYAAFTSAVRYYTITYLDDDGSVLKTVSMAYGATPSYEPEKEGYFFEGWEPELSAVTGDAIYTAKWKETITFATGSWTDISNISANGEAESYFKVGDTKDIPITYADGTTGTLEVAIAGFNHDDLADGSGKAGISIVAMSVPNIKCKWHKSGSAIPYGSIGNTDLKVRSTLIDTVTKILPAELRNVIKPVIKKARTYAGSIADIEETLWPLSLYELGHSGESASGLTPFEVGSKYDLFPTINAMVINAVADAPYLPVVLETTNSISVNYWTRDATSGDRIVSVTCSGSNVHASPDNTASNLKIEKYIRFGFCI